MGEEPPRPGPVGPSRYLPVAEHGLIGDMRSVALVGTNGTIDWYCCPRFDAPSVFASILDAERGGSFELAAAVPAGTGQFYFPDTNVLITRFFTEDGVGEVQDFMPVGGSGEAQRHRLIRRVLCVRGSTPFRARIAPRFDYARRPHTASDLEGGVVFESADLSVALTSTVPLDYDRRDATAVDFLTTRVAQRDEGASGPLQIMYGIDGRAELPEHLLDHLEGYRGSAPVRIGNAAVDQLQLDIYGELIDSIYLYDKWGRPISSDQWDGVCHLMEWVCDDWDQPDEGIWETRGGRKWTMEHRRRL